MFDQRDLHWHGCLNVRDLGGLATVDGATTRTGAVVRSDNPRHLTPLGWSQLLDHGIRTVVSLLTESADPAVDRRANQRIVVGEYCEDLTGFEVAVEDGDDDDFMQAWADGGLWATPLYFADALARWPQRHAAAVAAVARAGSGGVLIHCSRGCDRTGIVTMLLLASVGVPAELIAEDYERSAARLEHHRPGSQEHTARLLAERGTSAGEVVCDLLEGLDVADYLRSGGLTDDDVARLRARLVEPSRG